jgi:hypothetical protein
VVPLGGAFESGIAAAEKISSIYKKIIVKS